MIPFARPLAFKRTNAKKFLFKAEECVSHICSTTLYQTEDSGATFKAINTYVYDCFYADSQQLVIRDRSAIYCTVSKSKRGDIYELSDFGLMYSSDDFATAKEALKDSMFAMATGQYAVAVSVRTRRFDISGLLMRPRTEASFSSARMARCLQRRSSPRRHRLSRAYGCIFA